jgi:DmsE family decaheme c-type cytochrome
MESYVMRNIVVFTFCALAIFLTTHAAQCAEISSTPGDQQDNYVGSKTCMECHEDYYTSYMENRHGVKSDPRTPAAGLGCEACHGPGARHAASEGEEPIQSLKVDAAGSAEEKSAACLQCHRNGRQALWHGSEHASHNLSCSSCHNMHNNYPANLAARSETETCARCHKDIKAQLLRQSHHPLREGKMQCANCHNTHGTVADKLVDAQSVNQKCFECHTQLRGPFLWEHPSVTEDCLTCHTPHGSTHSELLKVRAPLLCQRCHANVSHPSELLAPSSSDAGQPVYRVLNNRIFYRACLNCHVAIHGSNHPSGKSLVR